MENRPSDQEAKTTPSAIFTRATETRARCVQRRIVYRVQSLTVLENVQTVGDGWDDGNESRTKRIR